MLLLTSPLSAAAPPPNLWKAGEEGAGAGQTLLPRGVAASPNVPGTVYVADQSNHRISLFSVWGQFIEAWGWGVRDGSSEFQICVSETGCVSGLEGEAPGAFKSPQGIVVDSSGNVFVVDRRNYRVQKFDSEGNFLLMIGGGVNQGPANPGDLCTAQNISEGDTCGPGSIGSEPGEFGAWPVGSFIALDPAGNISVGDDERIEKFTPGGAFIEAIEPPALAGKGFVQSLAQDAAGNYYVAMEKDPFTSENYVQKITPAAASACTMSVQNPRAIGVDGSGTVYVASDGTFDQDVTIERFDSGCSNLEDPVSEGLLDSTTGIGFGSACHSSGANIYITNAYLGNSFIRAYGPAPDNDVDCPPPLRPPTIAAQFATKVSASGVTLKAQINPHFWKDTSYFLEYGSGECKAEECDQLANSPGVSLGAGIVDEAKTTPGVPLTGLAPGTTYHYRFVAESSGGGPAYGLDPDGEGGEEASFDAGLEGTFTTMPTGSEAEACPNAAFRQGPAANLADCRAYEMVSPVDKEGGDVIALTNDFGLLARRDRAAAGGNAMTYSSYRAFANPAAAPYMSQYLAERGGAGWSSRSISPPRDGVSLAAGGGLDTQFVAFSEDLTQGWLIQDAEPVLASGGVPGFINAYRRENASNSYVALSTDAPVNTESEHYVLEVLGASAEGSHTVFSSNDYLPGGASEGVTQIYDAADGALSPVCILPNGMRSARACMLGTRNQQVPNQSTNVDHAISADGSRIYWSDGDSQAPGRLYLRVGGEETLPVSDLASPGAVAQFWTAAADGSKALFSIGAKLYEYDLASESVEEIADGTIGVAGASEDLSRIYLASEADLAEGAEAGKANLYLYEAGEAPSFELVAILAEGDVGGSALSPVAPLSRFKVSRVTPDGGHLVFMSQAPLTGAENLDAESGEADAEVFRYDAGEDRLACVSCNRTGARPSGRNVQDEVNINVPYWAAAQIPIAEGQTYTSRIISADGNRIFFESFQPLVLADTNGKQDVYEWQEAGAGSCDQADLGYDPASGGCVNLVSAGQSPQDSELLDASASGSDVFFTTSSSLVAQDPGLIDVYDARALGGFPPPPPPPLQCEGEACQAAPLVPETQTPSSSAFVGPGNPPIAKDKPKRCRKGTHKAKRKGTHKAKRKGKAVCVKNKAKKKSAAKRRAGR